MNNLIKIFITVIVSIAFVSVHANAMIQLSAKGKIYSGFDYFLVWNVIFAVWIFYLVLSILSGAEQTKE
jgi:hypothetical protein